MNMDQFIFDYQIYYSEVTSLFAIRGQSDIISKVTNLWYKATKFPIKGHPQSSLKFGLHNFDPPPPHRHAFHY